jgi:long-subunit acyl-CoA synthetase (AMP-forming)
VILINILILVASILMLHTGPNEIGQFLVAFALLIEPFTIENGLLTQTLKMRRNVVAEHYATIIQGLFR